MKNIFSFTNQYNGGRRYGSAAEDKSRLSALEILFFTAIIFYYLLPSINVSVSFLIVLLICVGYTAILCVLDSKKMEFYIVLFGLAIVISVMYYFLTETQTISAGVSNYTLKRLISKFQQIFMSFFPLLIFYRVATLANKKQKTYLLWLMSGIFLYVLMNTTIELTVNKDATRVWENFDKQSRNNVGTYAYVYAVPFIMALLPYLYGQCKHGGYKFGVVALGIFLFVFLLLAQYTLAILIAGVGFMLQIIIRLKDPSYKVLIVGCLILSFIAAPLLLNFVAARVPSQQMAARLREIANFFSLGDVSSDNLGVRLQLYWKAIKAFFKSPLFGNYKLGFDPHSSFLAMFADIGILGGLAFTSLYVLAKKQCNQLLSKAQQQAFLPAFVCLILMGLTNPIHSADPLVMAIWLFVPLAIMVLGKEKKNEALLGD